MDAKAVRLQEEGRKCRYHRHRLAAAAAAAVVVVAAAVQIDFLLLEVEQTTKMHWPRVAQIVVVVRRRSSVHHVG